MRDRGLEQAIDVAGGVGALARKIGISQPSLSNWTRVPAERVIAIEQITGIDRAILRPDLYRQPVGEVDAARGREYMLLGVLLRRAPDARLLNQLRSIRADASPLGIAHASLADAAAAANADRVEREFFDLFIGIGRGELLPYASYYLTGFLHERPLARLRDDLARMGIVRAEDEIEPEDHAAVLCEIMAGIAGGQFDCPAGADRHFFDRHLSPWVGRFFADLENAKAADFYRHVARVGRTFMQIETEAFALTE
jgi:TorA maturation chaperone TorD